MSIVVACSCGRKFQTKDEYAGRQAKCPACGEVLDIPTLQDDVQVESEERYGPEPGEGEEELSPAEEARRQRKLKAERDARIRRRYNLVALGSITAMVVVAVIWWGLTRGDTGAAPDKKPSPDTKGADGGQDEQNPQPALVDTTPKELPPPPSGQMDEIERYIQWAVLTKDSSIKSNALIFKRDDPRLQFKADWREPTLAQMAASKAKKSALASILDVEYGPLPSAATDQIEARMLMDPDLVGNGYCLGNAGKTAILYVFLAPCKATMPEVLKKYGPPTGDPLPSGNSKINFYGRMALVEVEDGKIHAVIRKQPK